MLGDREPLLDLESGEAAEPARQRHCKQITEALSAL